MESGHRYRPRIPRRRLERVDGSPVLEIEVDLADLGSTLPLPSPSREVHESGTETTVPPPPLSQDTEMEAFTQSPPPSRRSKRGAAGEGSGRKEAPVIELEGEYEDGSGWGEAHSRLAVEELQGWLSPSDQILARLSSYEDIHRELHEWLFPGGESPPPQSSAEQHNPIPLPFSYESGVEKGGRDRIKGSGLSLSKLGMRRHLPNSPFQSSSPSLKESPSGTRMTHLGAPLYVSRNGQGREGGGNASTPGGWRVITRTAHHRQ